MYYISFLGSTSATIARSDKKESLCDSATNGPVHKPVSPSSPDLCRNISNLLRKLIGCSIVTEELRRIASMYEALWTGTSLVRILTWHYSDTARLFVVVNCSLHWQDHFIFVVIRRSPNSRWPSLKPDTILCIYHWSAPSHKEPRGKGLKQGNVACWSRRGKKIEPFTHQ